ncbi:hypothetical protein [Nocardioides pantholopis]|uniref:hypothetical protein n=1 Tax=Nocardioides pantholopis TaxID=2483798 RepID=UPI000FDACBC8|nr:hypothetical protein [Nocardioides pantholopis]
MKRALCSWLIAFFVAGVISGCGGTDDPITTSSTGPAAKEAAPLAANVAYTYFNSDPLARFAVEIANPATAARLGVTGTWKALDADGVIVGTHDTELPTIAAGQSIVYVGGAGAANLTGTPAQVTFEVTDEGKLSSQPLEPSIAVSTTTLNRAEFDLNGDGRDYDVTLTLTALTDVNPADIKTNVILKNAAGKIVGADWTDMSTAPAALAAGDKVKVATIVTVPHGKPASVETFVSD